MKSGTPTKPGFYWYMVTRNVQVTAASPVKKVRKLWCVAVEHDGWKGLVGWGPMMDCPEPVEKDWNWDGEWLGEAIPPVDYDWPR